MATQNSVVNVQINAPKTLEQLENQLEGINQELKQVDINSDAFKKLSAEARGVASEIKQLETAFEGLSFEDKAGAIGDAAAGITGAFSLATQASGLFGEETAESFGKAEQQALQYIQAMEGIENVTKLFRGTTINTFKSLAGGFTNAIKSVRLFGLSSAASLALATAGITVLITAVIALVSNFDKVTAWFNDIRESIPIIDKIATGFEKIWEFISLIDNVWDGIVAGFKSLGDDSKTFAEAFNEGVKKSVEFEKSAEKLEKFTKERVKDLERELKVAESIKDNDDEVFKLKKQILTEELELLNAQEKLTKEQKERVKDLKTELTVLENQYKISQKILTIEEKRNKIIEDNNKGWDFIINKAERANQLFNLNNRELEKQNLILADATKEELELFDIGTKILELQQKQETLETQRNALIETNKKLREQGLRPRNIAADLEQLLLETFKAENEEIQLTNEYLLKQAEIYGEIEEDVIRINREKEAELQKTINSIPVQEEIADVNNNTLYLIRNQNRALQDQREEILQNGTEYERLALKLEEAQLALNLLGEAAMLGFEAQLVALDNALLRYQEEFDKASADLDEFYSKQIDYEDLLKDAQGDRFEEAKKGAEEQAETERQLLEAQRAAQNKIIAAENERAKIEKQQAIVDSLIQTALAVVQALPNIPLSVAVGILGAVQTGIIAGQNVPQQPLIPPIESKAEGGYTAEGGKYEPAGIVHKGEWVANQELVNDPFAGEMIAILEGMRLSMKGFASGGFTSPAPATRGLSAVRSVNDQPIYVAVTEIREVSRNVEVIESKAGI